MEHLGSGATLRPAADKDEWRESRIGRFLLAVEDDFGIDFADYEAGWQWSIDHLDEFWMRVWREFDIMSSVEPTVALESDRMPGARWFPGTRLNFAAHVIRALKARPDAVALIARSQTRGSGDWTAGRLLDEIARIRAGLIREGVESGDCVVGYLPNIPETVAAYLATVSLGAIWCSIPPEMGQRSVLDRVEQLSPRLVIAVDGYTWGAKAFSRAEQIALIRQELPAAVTVVIPYLDSEYPSPEGVIRYEDFTAETGGLDCVHVAFDHPLVVLFSSGTTGKPKGIVHGHGGILLEHFKAVGLQFGLDETDRAFWYTTTGWMVWTLSVSSLLVGTPLVLMDGDPNWPTADGDWSQWAVLAETESTYFVTGAAYLAASAHAGLTPGRTWDLSRVREIQCSGSPLAAEVATWVYRSVGPDLLLAPTSGGTDICSAFLGASPLTAVYAGEMSSRPLGVAVDAWGPDGRPVRGEPGELVCTRPMPSMPVSFWNDPDGSRYAASYFGMFPGVWRHGDWLIRTERDSWIITGRSDATLNRGGVRLGTAEFYTVLDAVPEVADSMVVHFEDRDGGMGRLVLLLVAAPGADRDALTPAVRGIIRDELSPRHVPDTFVFVPSVPRTATGKRLEIPLKRAVQGSPDAIDPGVLVHPEHLAEIVDLVTRSLQPTAPAGGA
jgi:acetoacetyl-CoA synthetase